jgi:hypothetical protein
MVFHAGFDTATPTLNTCAILFDVATAHSAHKPQNGNDEGFRRSTADVRHGPMKSPIPPGLTTTSHWCEFGFNSNKSIRRRPTWARRPDGGQTQSVSSSYDLTKGRITYRFK